MATAWRQAGALITHKMLGELSYEGLLKSTMDRGGYLLSLPDGVSYRFRARRGAFESWHVEPGSATRNGEPAWDPRTLVVDARETLGLTVFLFTVGLPAITTLVPYPAYTF